MNIRIQNQNTLEAAANELVAKLVIQNTLKAEQTEKINGVKKRHKVDIDPVNKLITSLRGKMARFLGSVTHAKGVFDGKETGTIKTNLASISLAKNPPAIEQLDKATTEEELVAHAKNLGVLEVIQTKQVLNKDALALLKDDELARLGFVRTQSKTLTVKLNANPELKAVAKIKE